MSNLDSTSNDKIILQLTSGCNALFIAPVIHISKVTVFGLLVNEVSTRLFDEEYATLS